MKVKQLKLQNFRVHGNSLIEIGDAGFVTIRGSNFAGKSTIGQALSMSLIPPTKGDRGFANKIKRGESKAVITANVQTKQYLIQRVVTLNAQTGRTQRSICLSDPEWNTAPFDRKLDANRAALGVALNTEAFLRMDEREQKNLLAGLALPASYEFDRNIVAGVEKVLGRGTVNFGGEPFAVINQAYKKLFDERTVVNRQVKEFVVPEPLPVLGDSRTLQEEIATLRMTRRDRQLERDRAVDHAAKVEAQREHLKAKWASLLTDDKLASLRAVAGRKEELDRLNNERQRLDTEIDNCLRELARLEQLPEETDGECAMCPTCKQAIDPEKVKAMAEALTATMQPIRDRHFAVVQQIKSLGNVDEAAKAIAKHEAIRGELVATEEPEPVLFDFRPYDQSVTQTDAEIERLSEEMRPVIAAEERAKEIKIRQEQLARLKEKADLLDLLVKYFDKDGIKAELLAKYVGSFEHKINEVMSAWGYSCSLSIEPYSFDVTNARGDTNPLRELSGAEEIMFLLAFQCAVSRTANIGMVVIDEVAMFLPELRPILNRRLYDMVKNGYLEQVILLVADTSWESSALPGTKLFMVEDGAVHPITREALVAG